jgi:hypothetical protein
VHALLHGRLLAALGLNGLFVLALPLMVAAWLARVRRAGWREALRIDNIPPRMFWVAGAVIVAFGVLRNVPIAPFTLLRP